MSAESGNPALRFDWTGDGMQYHQYGQYVGHEDYAKLEQQRAALVEALTRLHEACDDSDGSCYGTLSTSFVRGICTDALKAAGEGL